MDFSRFKKKYPNGGCPKMLLRIFSYQVNEYFTPMDDEMVAELCKQPIAQPTEDTPIKDESTAEVAAARLRIPNRQSTEKSADDVEVARQPSEKERDLIQPTKDVQTTDEMKTKQIEKIQDTPRCCRHQVTAPCDKIVDSAEEFIAKVLHNPEESETSEIIDESSSDTDAPVKEIFRYSQAMFTPYVSPFFYLSNYTHKPAVIVQDLIIKPDFNDIISSSLTFPPYINPFLFLPLTAMDYLTTDETIESRQVVDDTTKDEQASENLQHSSDGKIIKIKGLFLSEGGSTSSEGGSTSSEGGSTSSEGGSTTPEDGSTTPEDGSTTPEDGSTTPEDGSTTPEDGSTTPEDGSTTPEDGSTTPEDGSTTPEDGSTTPRTAPLRLRTAPLRLRTLHYA
ncbi:uncharacterized protein TNCT_335091 [Trichonephila clavata]|uniref:Uncharacterized protein n=1 Tax=Trichonephila clavata TaxID=2740835 RepID=A0A8X6K6N6_TRICU|nr:uncharacterized protein TNCT_335091 [Trichonephila clavata]